jgi:hypothetical protein
MQIDTTEELKLALKASVDVRTLRKALRGEPIKGRAGDRARAVLKAAGLLPAPAQESPAPAVRS